MDRKILIAHTLVVRITKLVNSWKIAAIENIRNLSRETAILIVEHLLGI